MNNIVRADFYRLFKSKFVYYGLTMCGILAILFNIISMEEKKMGTMPEMGTTTFIPMCISAVIGLTIMSDFAGGGIKNKIIMGNSRQNIYISWLISFIIVNAIYLGVYEICSLGSAKILGFDMSDIKAGNVMGNFVVLCFLLITNLVFSIMVCFAIPDGKCLVILLIVQEPPAMISGMLRSIFPDSKILDVFLRFIPQFQSDTLNITKMPDKPWLTIICTLALSVVLFICGIRAFNKKDLK